MTVLVVGGTGLIGASVVRRLVEQHQDQIVILDPTPPPATSPASGLGDAVTFLSGNVTDLALIGNIIRQHQIESIVHLATLRGTAASMRPIEALEVNVIGTANVLEAARLFDLRRVVITSSSAVMGAPEDLVTPRKEEEIVLPATGIYPLSKLAQEHLAHTYRVLYGVDAVAIRPRAVYGPGTPGLRPIPVAKLVEAAARGEEIVYAVGRDSEYDLTYVKDEAQGIVKALKAQGPLPRAVYNVSAGRNVSMGAVVDVLKGCFPKLHIEVGPGPWEGSLRRGVQEDLTYRSSARPPQDVSRARVDFGYDPTWPIERAIPDFAHWVQTGDYGELD